MTGATQFAILLGVLAGGLPLLLPGETGSTVVQALGGILLAMSAMLLWRRTRLVLSASAMAIGASFLIASLSGMISVVRENWAITTALVLIPLLLLFIESRLYPEQWRRWRRHAESCSLLDWLTFRHIPDWRGERLSDGASR